MAATNLLSPALTTSPQFLLRPNKVTSCKSVALLEMYRNVTKESKAFLEAGTERLKRIYAVKRCVFLNKFNPQRNNTEFLVCRGKKEEKRKEVFSEKKKRIHKMMKK